MNSLDSRLISYGDSFVQIFSRLGSYRYGFGPSSAREEMPFTVHVRETRDQRREEGKQHTVLVRSQGGRLIADRPEVELQEGDAVLWSLSDSATPAFSVRGYSETHSFNSAAMNSEALYIHPFGSAGIFNWRDANGRGPSGTVEVTMRQTRMGEKEPRLSSEAAMVVINGGKVEPAQIRICVNQAVVFVVEQAEGITITDDRLIF